jgi:hypothetical protein
VDNPISTQTRTTFAIKRAQFEKPGADLDARCQADLALGEMEAIHRRRIGVRRAVAADRAHARTQAIEREIAETRAEGLVGIGIQFGLWRFINGHFILGSDQADAAYEALVRLTGKDCTAEARAIVKHAGV